MTTRSALRLIAGPRGSPYHSVLWNALGGKIITNPTVTLLRFGDIHPFIPRPVFLATKVFVDDCDKNFVYYWINKNTFPKLEELHLMSHPCEPEVLQTKDYTTYLSDYFINHKYRWAANNNKVIVLKHQHMEADMYSHDPEEIDFYNKDDILL